MIIKNDFAEVNVSSDLFVILIDALAIYRNYFDAKRCIDKVFVIEAIASLLVKHIRKVQDMHFAVLRSNTAVEECDARDDAWCTNAGFIKKLFAGMFGRIIYKKLGINLYSIFCNKLFLKHNLCYVKGHNKRERNLSPFVTHVCGNTTKTYVQKLLVR